MAVIFRDDIGPYTGKGSKLTKGELDGNFYDLLLRVIALEDGGAFGVDTVEFTGNSITFHWSDSTTSGPFPLPVATFTARGLWDNDLSLVRLDVVTVPNVGTFLVQENHTTPAFPAEFDPAADNDSGDLLYLQIAEAVDLTGYMLFRDYYTGGTQYDEGDVFVDETYGLFKVNSLHTAAGTLDPSAEVDSTPLYTQLAGPPFAPVKTVTDDTYTLSIEDLGQYLRFTSATGCIITIPEIPGWPTSGEAHCRQAGAGALAFFAEDELVTTVNPPRVGYAASTQYQGATMTLKFVGSSEWDMIGPHGDLAS